MSMNKRECSKYANPGFSFDPGNGLLHVPDIEFIARSTIKNIAGRRVLVLYFYSRKALIGGSSVPVYTLFQCHDDYITLHHTDDGKLIWRTASLDNLGSRYTYITQKSAFYRQSDEQRVTSYCGNKKDKTGVDALDHLQMIIMAGRLDKRVKQREQKTVERMEPIPSTPRDLKGWIHREVLPHYIFYEYSRGSKSMKGYCTACCHDVLVSGVKHNDKGLCPHCGKAVTFKSSGRAKNVWDRATVQVLQKVNGNELILRIYKMYNTLHDWRKPRFSLYENARFFIHWTDEKSLSNESYYYSFNSGTLTNWKKGTRPIFSHYQYNFEADICGHLYSRNLDDALLGTPWQYCQIGRFYNYEHEQMEVIPYLREFVKYPSLEYLVKLNLMNLAAELVYGHEANTLNVGGKNLREALGVWPEDLPILQNVNANTRQLHLCQELRKRGICPEEHQLIWYKERNISAPEDILNPLAYTSLNKLIRYADEQYESLKDMKTQYGVLRYDRPSKVLSEYKDYLRMGGKLEYDLSDSFVLFPKNLLEAHDQASKLYDSKKNAIFNSHIRGAYTSLLEQYRFTKGGFTLIPPKSANEIVKEGHTLHHCVNTYVENVADGKCVILFIRQTNNIKAPFFTVEIQGDRIIQVHGLHHRAPTPEVQKFLDLWKRKKLQAVNA